MAIIFIMSMVFILGKLLTFEEQEKADEWIAENYPQYITAYMDLQLKDSKFPNPCFRKM